MRRLRRLIAGKNRILPIEVRGLPRLAIGIDLYHHALRYFPRAREEGTMNEMIPAVNRRVVVSHEGTRASAPSYVDFN